MKKIVFTAVFFTLIVIAITGGMIMVYSTSKDVNLKLIGVEKSTAFYLEDNWHMIRERDTELIKLYGIDIKKYNLSKYNLVISFGREIKKMTYKKNPEPPFETTNFVRTIFSKCKTPGKVYFYYIDKKEEVYYDERSNCENSIEQ